MDRRRRELDAGGWSVGWRRQWWTKQLEEEETRRAMLIERRRRRRPARRRMGKDVVCLYKRGTQQRNLGIIEVGSPPSYSL
jgi:hypothetical protein